VIVVSEFGGAPIAFESEIFPGVVAIPVKMPRRTVLDLFVSFKRLSRRSIPRIREATPRSGNPEHASDSTSDERLPLSARLREKFFGLVYLIDNFKKWTCYATLAASRAGKLNNIGLVICSGPPRSTLIGGAITAKRLGVPYIADLRDPLIEHPTDSPSMNQSWESRLLLWQEQWVVNSAAAITCTTAGLTQRMKRQYPQISEKTATVRNGFDGEIRHLPTDTHGYLKLLYAGEIYANRDPFPLLEALESLVSQQHIDSSRVSLTFVGKCESYRSRYLKNWLLGKCCENLVHILPPVPPAEISKLVLNATVLVNLTQNWPIQVPAKTYEQLASGREILVLCEQQSETARIVDPIQGVIRVDPQRPHQLLAALEDLYARHVQQGRLRAPRDEQVIPYSRRFTNEQFTAVIAGILENAEDRRCG